MNKLVCLLGLLAFVAVCYADHEEHRVSKNFIFFFKYLDIFSFFLEKIFLVFFNDLYYLYYLYLYCMKSYVFNQKNYS